MELLTSHLGETFAILCGMFWAMAVCLFKKSGETMRPMSLNLFKNTLAIGFFAITLSVLRQPLFIEAPPRDYILVILSGVIGMTIADTLFLSSLNRIGASLWGLVDCLYTPSVIVLAFFLLGERLTWSNLVGASLIISAILIAVVNVKELKGLHGDGVISGVLMGMAAIVLMALGGVMMKPVLEAARPLLWVIQLRLLAGTIGLVVIALLRRERWAIFAAMWPGRGWKYTVAGAFLGPYITILLWVAGMKYIQVSTAAILNQLSVLFIFVFAYFFLKEPMSFRRVLALIVAFIGVVFVVGL